MVENRSQVSALASQVQQISDPSQRAKAQADLEKISRPLAQQFLDWNGFKSRWNGTLQQVNQFLQSENLSTVNAGLGQVQVVPIAIAGALLVALGIVVGWQFANQSTSHAISLQQQALNGLLHGQITPAQYQQISDNIKTTMDAAANAAQKGSLQGAIQNLIPLALIVGGIVLLVKFMPSRKKA
jgi:hypothetical protein